MDQVVVDCGPDGGDEVSVGDRAVLLGPGDAGEPTAQHWADELGTLHYEVVTGVHGRRVHRTVVDGPGLVGAGLDGDRG
jgi:alanine racemase